MDAYLIVSKRSAFTRRDPLAQETVIHPNGENIQDAAAAASQWPQREREREREREKERGEQGMGKK